MLTNVLAGGIKCIEILCIETRAGVWAGGRSPNPPEANGGSGAGPLRLRRFYRFFQKPWTRAPLLLRPPLGAKAKTVHLLSLLYYSILTLNQICVGLLHALKFNINKTKITVCLQWSLIFIRKPEIK